MAPSYLKQNYYGIKKRNFANTFHFFSSANETMSEDKEANKEPEPQKEQPPKGINNIYVANFH